MIVVGVFLVARLGRVKVRQFVGTFLKWNGSCRSSAECHRLQRGHVHRCCSNTLNGNDSLDTLRTFGLSIVVDLICRTIVLTSEVEIVVAIVLVAAGRVRRGVGRNLDIVVDKFPERFESPNFWSNVGLTICRCFTARKCGNCCRRGSNCHLRVFFKRVFHKESQKKVSSKRTLARRCRQFQTKLKFLWLNFAVDGDSISVWWLSVFGEKKVSTIFNKNKREEKKYSIRFWCSFFALTSFLSRFVLWCHPQISGQNNEDKHKHALWMNLRHEKCVRLESTFYAISEVFSKSCCWYETIW